MILFSSAQGVWGKAPRTRVQRRLSSEGRTGRTWRKTHLLPAEQQQLTEALRLLARVLGDGHEGVGEQGQRAGARLLLGPLQRLVVEVDEVGLVGRLPRQPNGLVLTQEQVSDVCPHHSLQRTGETTGGSGARRQEANGAKRQEANGAKQQEAHR